MIDAAAIADALGLRRVGCEWQGPCPACGYPGAFAVRDADGLALVKCHAGCSQDVVLEALQGRGLRTEATEARRPFITDKSPAPPSDLAKSLWAKRQPVAGSPVEHYLKARGITGPIPPTIAYLPDCRHKPSDTSWPVMLAAVTRWPSREVVAVHRTYLAHDGSGKAPVSPARMSLGPLAGGSVHLGPAGPVLGLAEGIETGLSAMEACGFPVWACLSTGGLRAVELPTLPLAEEVVIAADNDRPGLAAAKATAERLWAAGRRVSIATPPLPGQDFNDLARLEATNG